MAIQVTIENWGKAQTLHGYTVLSPGIALLTFRKEDASVDINIQDIQIMV